MSAEVAAALEPSVEIREFIKRPENEGLYLSPYCCPGGEWTQGFGHTRGISPDSPPITIAIAERWLTEDIAIAVETVRAWVRVPLSQGQFDALVSFVFNLGPGAPNQKDGFVWLKKRATDGRAQHSTLLNAVNARDWKLAAEQFPLWVRAGGKVLNGLVKRRAEERRFFEGGN